MEARSLASLNLLAANPPQYPVNPTEQRQDPLTLYISRVPGTRDVILSPFKPQVKNVTAEDVASSLYYIHLDTSLQDLAAPPPISRQDALNSSDEGSPPRTTIRRKPVAGTARPVTPEEFAPPPPPQHLHVSPGSGNTIPLPGPEATHSGAPQLPPISALAPPPLQVPSRPLEDSGVSLPEPNYSPSEQSHVPPRKPLGPRVAGDSPTSGTFLPPIPQPEPFTSSERPYSQQSLHERPHRPDYALPPHERPYSREGDPPPAYQAISQARPQSHDFAPYHEPPRPPPHTAPRPRPVSTQRPKSYSRSPSPRKNGDTFNLSLIRRDPSSGNQWNVGRVSSRHFESMPPLPSDDTPAPRPPIDVQLETSGYAKFRNMPARKSIDAMAPQIAPVEDMAQGPGIFARQVVMSYSKSWSSTLKQRLNRLDRNSFTPQPKTHSRNRSSTSADSIFSSPESGPTTTPGPGMKPRGYMFNSPWDGRCEFRTGNAGRSVRCHHILHEGPTAHFNPLVAEQQGQTATTPPSAAASTVSELRFNLPSSEIMGSSEQDQTGVQKLGNLRKFWRREGDDDLDDEHDEVSPFDVNLGRERAGGGNRGKRAKLGKLIIYPDGLKMLDLIVAANMGVWWGAWERSF